MLHRLCRKIIEREVMIVVDTETGSIRDITINEIVNRINSDVGFNDNEYVYYNHDQYYNIVKGKL